ncbi:MAG: PIN domain-containing protein [Deltaproteobacteria bacterium]|nr:PIN domain-containing protein [Deltaproteobacteria bacterium]
MIALDTNILVYARRQELPNHRRAAKLVRELAEGDAPWALPWPCIYEFLRVVTHPRIFSPPTDLTVALEDVESLLASPSLTLLGEGPTHPAHMRQAIEGGRASGNLVHDAHIAALLVEHGVRELLTTDRDFSRFPGVRARDPFPFSRASE